MLIAAIPFSFVTLANVVQGIRGRTLALPWRTLVLTVLVVWGSYLVAGQIAAFAFYLLRPLRSWLIGWLATGFSIAVICYGVIGVSLALFYEPVGRAFLDHTTREEAWELVRFTPWLGIAGIIGGAWFWMKEGPKRTRAVPSNEEL